MSSEKKEKKQHKVNFNIKEKLKKTFSKEHLKEVFTGEEQKLIAQYALNTPQNLLSDLEAAMRVLKDSRLSALFASTRDKAAQVPPDACRRLMADLRFTYQSRHQQELRQRARSANRPKRKNKTRSDMER